MGKNIRITASDGHTLDAYVAEPQGTPKAGLVVLQEIFGVNSHIRDVTDRFAREGYKAVAPALFDRVERGYEARYDDAAMKRGFEIVQKLSPDTLPLDIAAAIQSLGTPRVGVIGYCMGGMLAWNTAVRQPIQAAVVYYGGPSRMIDQKANCPVLGHFGSKDKHILVPDVQAFFSRHPEATVHIYDADHGFNCDQRASYDAPSARLAYERTLEFFRKHLDA